MEKTPEEIKAILNPTPPEEKTDIQLQSEALIADKKKDEEYEKQLLKAKELSEALKEDVKEVVYEPLTANTLKSQLGGSYEERLKQDRTIVLTMRMGEKPEVVFTGFWNGKLVGNATNAISRAYRVQRHKNIRANATELNPTT